MERMLIFADDDFPDLDDAIIEDDVADDTPDDGVSPDDDAPQQDMLGDGPQPEIVHQTGEKAFSADINDNLLCPSQVYEYVELIDSDANTVRYVGYDERDTYEAEESDDIIEMLFRGMGEEQEVDFDEQRAARALSFW